MLLQLVPSNKQIIKLILTANSYMQEIGPQNGYKYKKKSKILLVKKKLVVTEQRGKEIRGEKTVTCLPTLLVYTFCRIISK